MKQQILWKRIDLIGQVCMLIAPCLYSYHDAFFGRAASVFFVMLFTVGGWQVLSAIVHAITFPRQYWRGGRTGYYVALAIILMFGLLFASTQSDAIVGGLMSMLVIGPLLAIWYFSACITELNYLVRLQKQGIVEDTNP